MNMLYKEEDLIQLSALPQFVFCQRRFSLIHIEQIWEDNRLTAEGNIMHDRVHNEGTETRGEVRIERGIALRSLKLGVIGKADVVEFHRQPDGPLTPFPVEYKRGKPKPDHSDEIQLCAQALCLEEMLGKRVPAGAIFYGRTRRRLEVKFDDELRRETCEVAKQARALLASGITPKPIYEKRCESCSLLNECLPKSIQKKRSVKNYLKRILEEP